MKIRRQKDRGVQGRPFIDFATGYVKAQFTVDTHGDDDAEWFQCFEICRISPPTQASIMDPIYRRLRLTRSCITSGWIIDTMNMRYLSLESMTSHERPLALWSGPASKVQREEPGLDRETAMSATALAAQTAPGFTVLFKCMSYESIKGMFSPKYLPRSEG
jgi:hypothetical protein